MKIKVKQVVTHEVDLKECGLCCSDDLGILYICGSKYQVQCNGCGLSANKSESEYDAAINWDKLMARLEL